MSFLQSIGASIAGFFFMILATLGLAPAVIDGREEMSLSTTTANNTSEIKNVRESEEEIVQHKSGEGTGFLRHDGVLYLTRDTGERDVVGNKTFTPQSATDTTFKHVDFNTFVLIDGTDWFVKDAYRVYKLLPFAGMEVLVGADPITFRSIGEGGRVAADSKGMWLDGYRAPGDADSFVRLDDFYYKDKNFVYYQMRPGNVEVRRSLDPKTFRP